jgi:hypothetical protein
MGTLSRLVPVEPAAEARATAPVKPRCEACRRVDVVVELRRVADEHLWLCVNPVECRCNWPAGEANE